MHQVFKIGSFWVYFSCPHIIIGVGGCQREGIKTGHGGAAAGRTLTAGHRAAIIK